MALHQSLRQNHLIISKKQPTNRDVRAEKNKTRYNNKFTIKSILKSLIYLIFFKALLKIYLNQTNVL